MSNQPVRGNAGGAGNNQPPAAGNNQPPGAAGPAYTAEQLLPNILNIVSRQGFNSNLPRNSLRGVSRATKEGINAISRGRNAEFPPDPPTGPVPANPIQELARMIRAKNRNGIQKLLRPGIYRKGLFRREIAPNAGLTPAVIDTPLDYTGRTLLLFAVEQNDVETVRALLAMGANPNGKALPAGTPLAEQGARVSAPDPRALGFPATNLAAYNGNLPILQALVEAGGNINAWAGMGGGEDPAIVVSLECALLGLEYMRGTYTTRLGGKYRYNRQGLQSKFAADPDLFQKYINIFYYALDHGGDVNTRGMGMRTPLRSAVEITMLDPPAIWLVQDLLNRGADPEVRENMGEYQRTTREVVTERGTPELKALFASVPQGGYTPSTANASAQEGAAGGAAGGNQGGGRRYKVRRASKKTRRAKKSKKHTRKH